MELLPKSYEFHLKKAKESKCWPKDIAEKYGEQQALAFLFGLDCIIDEIEHDLEILESQPKGTHIGQLEFSYIRPHLPDLYLTRYDHEFLYKMLGIAQEIMRGEWHREIEYTIQNIVIYGATCEASESFSSYYELDDPIDPQWEKDMNVDLGLKYLFCPPTSFQLAKGNLWLFENWFTENWPATWLDTDSELDSDYHHDFID